jgi:hypothetical protein
MTNKTQEESEAPAKVYQVDAIAKKLADIELLIRDQNITYITKDELALALLPVTSRVKNLEDKDRNRSKLVWVLVSAVTALAANTLWQLVINTGRVQ